MKFTKQSQFGMTLIEALIAIAIFAVFALLINSIFINILRGAAKQESLKEVKQSGDIAMTELENKIREAAGLAVCSSTASNTLTLNGQDPSQITILQVLADPVDTTQLRIAAVTGTDVQYLTNSLVELPADTSLSFTCRQGRNPLVTINFTLQHNNNSDQPLRAELHAEMTFTTTVGLRTN